MNGICAEVKCVKFFIVGIALLLLLETLQWNIEEEKFLLS